MTRCSPVSFLVGNTLLLPLHSYLTVRHVLMISVFILNSVAFTVAAVYVYKLGRQLHGKG